MSYLNPHTHHLDGPDGDGEPRGDTVGTLRPKLAMLAHKDVLAEVAEEMARQDAKWGIQEHPDGTGGKTLEKCGEQDRRVCQEAFRRGAGTWRHILSEEVSEAFAESDPVKLRAELVQVEAVCAQWRKAIDRRTGATR